MNTNATQWKTSNNRRYSMCTEIVNWHLSNSIFTSIWWALVVSVTMKPFPVTCWSELKRSKQEVKSTDEHAPGSQASSLQAHLDDRCSLEDLIGCCLRSCVFVTAAKQAIFSHLSFCWLVCLISSKITQKLPNRRVRQEAITFWSGSGGGARLN